MSLLNKLHLYLESELPATNKKGLQNSMLFCSFAYILLSAYVVHIVPSNNTSERLASGGAYLLAFFESFWWLFIVAAVSCLLIWHFINHTRSIKTSAATGISILIISHLFLMVGTVMSLNVHIVKSQL